MGNVAINGFGRIGRSILRIIVENDSDINVVAINDLGNYENLAYLLKHDSVMGILDGNVSVAGDKLIVDDRVIQLTSIKDPADLPWKEMNVDVVVESTGIFRDSESLNKHLDAGAKKVLFSQPADPDMDATIVYGINDDNLTVADKIVSNGSCTTNCIVPVIKVLDDAFGIESGAITTIHASMHDQQVIDAYHPDLRRTRAASQSIIPVDTKLARGIERILPKFEGRFEAIAMRVPTINVTAMDLSITTNTDVTIEKVNQVLASTSNKRLAGILSYTEEPLVSIDFNHDPHSSIIDGTQTRVSHKRLVKCLVWCDNEWGFANRMLDTAKAMMLAK